MSDTPELASEAGPEPAPVSPSAMPVDNELVDEQSAADESADTAADPPPVSLSSAEQERGRLFPRIAVGSVLLVMVFHFTMTALYINPVSVVGLYWNTPVHQYMEPLFRQRWSLFAPNPPKLNRRLDYQCQIEGEEGEWSSRSETLIDTHARRRFSPASRLRRVETAAIAATVGSEDQMLSQLAENQDKAPEAQKRAVEDVLAQRVASNIRSSRMAYELVRAYCIEDHGRLPEQLRYRIVTQPIPPYSIRNEPEKNEDPKSMTLPWLAPDDFDSLEDKAKEFIALYEQQQAEVAAAKARGEEPLPEGVAAPPSDPSAATPTPTAEGE